MLKVSNLESFWKDLQGNNNSIGFAALPAKVFLWLLVPLFQGISLLKRFIFSLSCVFRTRLSLPVITIGNITMGGTGKTTVARLVTNLLNEKINKTPAILSRGYRSGNKRSVLPVSRKGELLISQSNCGDEAFLLAKWLPQSSVVLGKRRAVTGLWAVENLSHDYILLDDGHQYWRLERDFNIVTVSAMEGFGNQLPFPRGVLREPVWGLKRADLVVLYQYSEARESAIEKLKEQIRLVNNEVPVVGVDIIPGKLRKLNIISFFPGMIFSEVDTESSESTKIENVTGVDNKVEVDNPKVFAFSGLGSPSSFISTLKSCNYIVQDSISFSDHHKYVVSDIDLIIDKALSSSSSMIVTTEKDEVNCCRGNVLEKIRQSPISFYVLPVEGKFTEGSKDLTLSLLQKIF